MCCTRLAENTECKKYAKNRHLRTIAQLCLAISLQLGKACIDNRKNSLLNSNISATCLHNMVNFGPLTAEICWRVWGTPANFNRFCVLGFVTAPTSLNGGQQTLHDVWPSPGMVHYILHFSGLFIIIIIINIFNVA